MAALPEVDALNGRGAGRAGDGGGPDVRVGQPALLEDAGVTVAGAARAQAEALEVGARR